MKKYITIFILILTSACSSNKGVYWCGDHPCLNKKEKEAYFSETMIVEVREFNKKEIKKDSEFEKLFNQAKLNEKERILTEKELITLDSINIEKLDYDTYKDTCRWLGCKPNLSQNKFINVMNESKNKIHGKKIKISKKDLEYFKKYFNKTEKLLFKNNK